MVYLNPDSMTREKRELLLEWVTAEGLDPATIVNDGHFSVHNGRISGHQFMFTHAPDGTKIMRSDGPVKVHFSVTQKNQLPEEIA